jgi:hypothetical protein
MTRVDDLMTVTVTLDFHAKAVSDRPVDVGCTSYAVTLLPVDAACFMEELVAAINADCLFGFMQQESASNAVSALSANHARGTDMNVVRTDTRTDLEKVQKWIREHPERSPAVQMMHDALSLLVWIIFGIVTVVSCGGAALILLYLAFVS